MTSWGRVCKGSIWCRTATRRNRFNFRKCKVKKSKAIAGYFRSGLPYNRFGDGARTLVIFQGLVFENKPLAGLLLPLFSGIYTFLFLDKDYTTYIVNRKPGLPDGYTLKDMSDDYATMIRDEFGGPVDVIGVSTGVPSPITSRPTTPSWCGN